MAALPIGGRTPWLEAAGAWIDDVLQRGAERVLAFDYGATSTAELVERGGWLRTYRRHQRGDDPYVDPGSADITIDVAFDQLPNAPQLVRQAEFLRRSRDRGAGGGGTSALGRPRRSARRRGAPDAEPSQRGCSARRSDGSRGLDRCVLGASPTRQAETRRRRSRPSVFPISLPSMQQVERPTLSRESIARAALDLIDAEGLAGLSMRKLGAKLGVEAMSLYHYVANKDDLLDAAVEQIYLEIEIPVPDDPAAWEATVRCRSASRFVTRWPAHPNAISLFVAEPAVSPGAFGVLLCGLRPFPFRRSRTGRGARGAPPGRLVRARPSDAGGRISSRAKESSSLVEVTDTIDPASPTFIESGGAREADALFEFGLDIMIAGLRARFDSPDQL